MSVFIIAEAGSNHDGSLQQALALIDAAADAGVDACKFQMFRSDDLYPKDTEQWRAVKPLEMPTEWLLHLSIRCASRGIEFMCSCFDEASVDAVDPYVNRHKIASLEATDRSLIRHVVSKGKPVIVSTGTLDSRQMHELRFEEMGDGGTALGMDYSRTVPTTLMHCTTAYPCPPEEANMLALYYHDEMGRDCDGFSDHTTDPIIAPVMAVALGATTVEKHFTLSRSLKGPDHAYALDPYELKQMVAAVRLAERMLGDGSKRVMPSEQQWVRWQHKDGGLRGG